MIWGEGHKISNIVLGFLKFITPVLGGYKFSYMKLLGFNCLAKCSAIQLIKTGFCHFMAPDSCFKNSVK